MSETTLGKDDGNCYVQRKPTVQPKALFKMDMEWSGKRWIDEHSRIDSPVRCIHVEKRPLHHDPNTGRVIFEKVWE